MSEPRIALVTGANKGIGREVVRQLAALGWRVFLGSRDPAAGEAAAGLIEGDVEALALDVNDLGSLSLAARAVSASVDRLDVLINNAAILEKGDQSALTLSPEIARGTFETNVLGTLRATQAFLPLLRKSAAPRIVNVSSLAGQLTGDLQSWSPAYSVSKTALNGLTQQFAADLDGFAVNAVSPGWVRTDMGGAEAPLSVEEGAAGIVWLAVEAPQTLTGKFIKDRKVIEW